MSNTYPMNHIRVIDTPRSRRLMGSEGQSHNLCGAPLTSYDIRMADAKQAKKHGQLARWLRCPTCQKGVP